MRQYIVNVAEKISISLEEAAGALLDKLCEGEPEEVRRIAWDMFATRITFANGQCDLLILPQLEEC